MSTGKYFTITSQHSGHALGPTGGQAGPGARLTMCSMDCANKNLLFYYDSFAGVIKHFSGTCIHIGGDGEAILKPLEPGNSSQQWSIAGNKIHQKSNQNKVLDLAGGDQNVGAKVLLWDYHGGSNQHWDIKHLKPRYFFIVSQMHGKVLDVEGGSKAAGTKVCLWDKKGSDCDNQLWYEDKDGIIHSKFNDMVFDSNGPDGDIVLQPLDTKKPNHKWAVNGNVISQLQSKDNVLDIRASDPNSGAHILAYKLHGGPNQKWNFEYIN